MKSGTGMVKVIYICYSFLSLREIYLLDNIRITGKKELGYRTSKLLKGKEGKRKK